MRRAARRLSSQILILQLLILTGTVLVGFALAPQDVRGRVNREYEQPSLVAAHAVAAVPEIAAAVERADPSDALTGRTVLAVESGTLGRSARAKVPLRADDGRIVGIVSVGILEGALLGEVSGFLGAMALYLAIALGVGVVASLLLARRLKRQTFGLELDELASLVHEREAMLHGIPRRRRAFTASEIEERV